MGMDRRVLPENRLTEEGRCDREAAVNEVRRLLWKLSLETENYTASTMRDELQGLAMQLKEALAEPRTLQGGGADDAEKHALLNATLYHAISEMLAEIAAKGTIRARHRLTDALVDALAAIPEPKGH